jgi:hypothetical protein
MGSGRHHLSHHDPLVPVRRSRVGTAHLWIAGNLIEPPQPAKTGPGRSGDDLDDGRGDHSPRLRAR